jgi:hypothetical protein
VPVTPITYISMLAAREQDIHRADTRICGGASTVAAAQLRRSPQSGRSLLKSERSVRGCGRQDRTCSLVFFRGVLAGRRVESGEHLHGPGEHPALPELEPQECERRVWMLPERRPSWQWMPRVLSGCRFQPGLCCPCRRRGRDPLTRGQFYVGTDGTKFIKTATSMRLGYHPAAPLTEEQVIACAHRLLGRCRARHGSIRMTARPPKSLGIYRPEMRARLEPP